MQAPPFPQLQSFLAAVARNCERGWEPESGLGRALHCAKVCSHSHLRCNINDSSEKCCYAPKSLPGVCGGPRRTVLVDRFGRPSSVVLFRRCTRIANRLPRICLHHMLSELRPNSHEKPWMLQYGLSKVNNFARIELCESEMFVLANRCATKIIRTNVRGPRMVGWIRRVWISHFGGAPIFSPEVPNYIS